jgi:uncharacterized protein YggE
MVGAIAVAAAGWVGRDDPKATVASPQPAPAAGSLVRSITVTGEGKVKVKPDTASLNVGVQATAKTATEALDHANKSGAALIAALKAAGISADDIATSGLSIYPQYGSTGSIITGYQAANSVNVTVRDIARTGPVIDAAAAAAGDNITVNGVSFYVDDTEALIGAARADAISEASVATPLPQVYAAAADAAGRSVASTPIETGTQDLNVTVTVVYELS